MTWQWVDVTKMRDLQNKTEQTNRNFENSFKSRLRNAHDREKPRLRNPRNSTIVLKDHSSSFAIPYV